MKNEKNLLKEEFLLKVIALSTLLERGFKIARLSGNRNFDEKVVKAKMKSMKANGMLVINHSGCKESYRSRIGDCRF